MEPRESAVRALRKTAAINGCPKEAGAHLLLRGIDLVVMLHFFGPRRRSH